MLNFYFSPFFWIVSIWCGIRGEFSLFGSGDVHSVVFLLLLSFIQGFQAYDFILQLNFFISLLLVEVWFCNYFVLFLHFLVISTFICNLPVLLFFLLVLGKLDSEKVIFGKVEQLLVYHWTVSLVAWFLFLLIYIIV